MSRREIRMIHRVLGAARLAGVAFALLTGSVLILFSSLLPVRVKGVRPALWLARGLAASLCLLFGVHVRSRDPARFCRPWLLIFPNHCSLLDALVLLRVAPVRFLAAAEVTDYPLIGGIVRAIESVLVARGDVQSRRQARDQIRSAMQTSPYPPLVIFPEGRLGFGNRLFPFRYGAFEIALEQGLDFIPCALRYDPWEIAVWRGGEGEALWTAAWRLACSPVRVTVDVIPLEKVSPGPSDEPACLADAARSAMVAALGISLEPAAEPQRVPRN